MSAAELTPWFPGSVNPKRRGVYQREFQVGIGFCRWDGRRWYVRNTTPLMAAQEYRESGNFGNRWRGLSAPAKGSK